MKLPLATLRRIATAAAIAAFAIGAAQVSKRPLTHKDYASWRSIVSQRLSPDGKLVAYFLFPQEGDGELVIRDIATGKERREAVGSRPTPAPRSEGSEPEERSESRGPSLVISPDSRFVAFTVFPTKAESEKAKKEKKKTEEAPRAAMGILDLSLDAAATRVARIENFAMPEEAGAVLVYHKAAAPSTPAKTGDGAETDQASKKKSGGATSARTPRRNTGSDLVLRDLKSGAERTLADVLEFSLTRDGSTLVYTVGSKEQENNGVYTVAVTGDAAPQTILKGKGRYSKLTWDEDQKRVAFLSTHGDAASKRPKYKLYVWPRGGGEAEALDNSAGLASGFAVSERGSLSYSRNGGQLFFGVAPAAAAREEGEEEPAESAPPATDKPVADLWHWRDDFIPPMQKVRATQERNRTWRAVYHFASKKTVQLADRTMNDIVTAEQGSWALGQDDSPYRRMVEYDARYSDTYLVNIDTGDRKPVARKRGGTPSFSPDGKYMIYWEGRNWHSMTVPGAVAANLTGKLGVAFWNRLDDRPEEPHTYGSAGWTRDGKYVLLYDEYDVWQVAADGSTAVCLTAGYGRRTHTQFRVIRLERDPRNRHIDPSKPLLLRAENTDTRDTGFWRARVGASAEPTKLIMEAKNFTAPATARKAETLLFTASTFRDYPDLLVSGPDFKDIKRVSNANPQKDEISWGSAELIRYKNADGVELSGVLIKPEGMQPGKKYPMMVYIYERLSQTVNSFHDPRPNATISVSYYVSNGYVVLMPDIAYTIGYPGQSALKCVLPAVQAVVDRGFVDEKAIGIQGHSWGGYQIAYMVTQTNRFKAAAPGALVANMISAYDGIRWGPGLPRQFQYEQQQSRIGASIWQAPMRYIENSPIFMADRVKTPLLMIHNDGDDAVPWYQGIEYFLALRRLGKEVYMFNYNGEPHGLRKRENQKDYTVRLQEFFDHHLKGAPAPEWMQKGVPYLEREKEKDRLKTIYGQ